MLEFDRFIYKHFDVLKNIKSNYCILLLDEDGILLTAKNCINDNQSKNKYKDFFKVGALFSEESIGTNAVTLSGLYRKPVYMYPAFHYCTKLKGWYQYCVCIGNVAKRCIGYVSLVNIKKPICNALEGFINILAVNLVDKKALRDNRDYDTYNLDRKLSNKQNMIIKMIALGLSDEYISQELKISLSTVKYHNQNIFKKLNASCRVDAVVKAIMSNEILFSDLCNM